jgi:hypothetical protein
MGEVRTKVWQQGDFWDAGTLLYPDVGVVTEILTW